jgi:hypothetical protein
MVSSEIDILVVDDIAAQGEIVEGHINERTGYQGVSAMSIPKLVQSMLFGVYEGAMIDVIWDKWHDPVKLGDKEIEDGIDLAEVLFDVNPRLEDSIALYSSAADLREPFTSKIRRLPFKPKFIRTPFPVDRDVTQKKLDPVLDEAKKVHKSDPLLQSPQLVDEPLNKRIYAYKSVCAEYSKFLDFHFNNVGDYAFAVFCGPRADKDLYGKAVNGHHNGFGIKANDKYPSEERLTEISKETGFFPFPFWNIRELDFLERQFELAGERLSNVPEKWRSLFGIAIAKPCAEAYRAGNEDKVLGWCKQLDEVGKLEACKQIYRLLRAEATPDLAAFANRTEQHELPVIIDVLTGTTHSIDPDEQSATVVMETHDGNRFPETMRLERLERSCIKFIETEFEYTVYRLPRGEVTANIELCVAREGKEVQ